MDWGHGFIPRIDQRNWSGVDRALGPPGRLPLDGPPLDVPWAIVDLPWVRTKPSVLADLRGHGVRVLLDGGGWRYRELATFGVARLTNQSFAPQAPLDASDLGAVRQYVRLELREQARLNADAYLIPGFIPRTRTDDVQLLIGAAVEAAMGCAELDAKPFVLFVGAHADNLARASEIIAELPRSIAGLYLQITPLTPMRDGPSKLLRYSQFLRVAGRDFDVIAGHAGAISTLLRALGVPAADAGIAEAETFTVSAASRPRKPSASLVGKGMGRRIYVPALGRSMSGKEWQALMDIPALHAFLRCTLPCCRFSTLDTTRTRAVEHSLRARIHESLEQQPLPDSLRLTQLLTSVQARQSTLLACNSALAAHGAEPIRTAYVDNQLSLLARLLANPNAA